MDPYFMSEAFAVINALFILQRYQICIVQPRPQLAGATTFKLRMDVKFEVCGVGNSE